MSYRHISAQKRSGGKVRRYRNLAVFNKECGKRSLGGNICTLTNIRRLKDGSGLATVKSDTGVIRGRKSGTWLLHFASHNVMKQHLKGRVDPARSGMLDGARKRRR
jgi:hypothetical protein